MKQFYTVILMLFVSITLNAQIVFQSNFENWTDGNPDGWDGDKTNFEDDSIIQINTGAVYGNFACQLINTTNSGKRFSTEYQSVEVGQSYDIKYWVKGEGQVSARIFDSEWGTFNSYTVVNSSDWIELTQTVTAVNTWDSAEFIIYARNTISSMGFIQLDSVVITLTDLQPTDATVYDIQFTTDPNGVSPLINELVSTSGIVTAVYEDNFYLQDGQNEWNSIFVYNSENNPQIGDKINVEAIVAEYFGLTELKSLVNYEVESTGNTITHNIINVAQANSENWEGCFVQVENVTCTELPDEFGVWKVEDGQNNELIIDDDIYAFIPVLGNTYNITGVITYSFDLYRLLPRSAADINVVTSLTEYDFNDFNIYPNPVIDKIIFSSEEIIKSIEIYDLTGKRLLTETLLTKQSSINIELQSGVYFATFTTEDDQKGIKKIVVR